MKWSKTGEEEIDHIAHPRANGQPIDGFLPEQNIPGVILQFYLHKPQFLGINAIEDGAISEKSRSLLSPVADTVLSTPQRRPALACLDPRMGVGRQSEKLRGDDVSHDS